MAQAQAQQVIKYVGRTTDFKGKTLWEIVGNLKDFGVGRIVIRNMFQRYKEPCFIRILKVEGQPNEYVRKVKVTVEKVFRGVKAPEPQLILRASYKADYVLIPKHLEKNFVASISYEDKVNQRVLQKYTEYPPLLKRFLIQETGNKDPKLELKYFDGLYSLYRVAKDGETPNVKFESGLGTPVSPNLYENIKRQ